MKRIIFTSLLSVMAMISQAGNRPDVEGQILDEEGKPIEFVNVVLLNADSTFVQHSETNQTTIACMFHSATPSMLRRANIKAPAQDRMLQDE